MNKRDLSDTPDPVREAYARKLNKMACDLEKAARNGRDFIKHTEQLGGLWCVVAALRNLAEEFDPGGVLLPPGVPFCFPPDEDSIQ